MSIRDSLTDVTGACQKFVGIFNIAQASGGRQPPDGEPTRFATQRGANAPRSLHYTHFVFYTPTLATPLSRQSPALSQ